jgi:hypothetical protein
MQQKTKFLALVAASVIATTAGAYAQGYNPYRNTDAWDYNGPNFDTAQPRVMYRPVQPGWYGSYGSLNGTNHPTPNSSQGDVGPEGNNNGTLTGLYRQW